MKRRAVVSYVRDFFVFIFPFITLVLSICLFSFSTSKLSGPLQTTYSRLVCNEVIDDGYIYSTTILDEENSTTDINTFFGLTYGNNFTRDNVYQRMPIIVDSNGEPLKCDLSFNGESLPLKTALANSYAYSNQEDLLRLECYLLNIYKFQDRTIETTYDDALFDGYIYIPDYYADEIIENSDSLNTYDDLLENSDENVISITMQGTTKNYKIANIFHINGFNEEYCVDREISYNDQNCGLMLNTFLNGFCFVSDYNSYSQIDGYQSGLLCAVQGKQFILSMFLEQLYSFFGSQSEISISLQMLNSQSHFENSTYENAIETAYFDSYSNSPDSLLMILSLVISILTFIALYYSFNAVWCLKRIYLMSFISSVFVLLLIVQLVGFLSFSVSWGLFFNQWTNFLLVVFLVGAILMYFIFRHKSKKRLTCDDK